jgi:hypothetical protein
VEAQRTDAVQTQSPIKTPLKRIRTPWKHRTAVATSRSPLKRRYVSMS